MTIVTLCSYLQSWLGYTLAKCPFQVSLRISGAQYTSVSRGSGLQCVTIIVAGTTFYIRSLNSLVVSLSLKQCKFETSIYLLMPLRKSRLSRIFLCSFTRLLLSAGGVFFSLSPSLSQRIFYTVQKNEMFPAVSFTQCIHDERQFEKESYEKIISRGRSMT